MHQRLAPKLQLVATLLAGAFLALLLWAVRQPASQPMPPQPTVAPTLLAAASATPPPSPAVTATPGPFPTAAPSEVQVIGAPLDPDGSAVASTRLGQLTLELRLERLSYIAGEAGHAELRLINSSTVEVWDLNWAQLVVLQNTLSGELRIPGSSTLLTDIGRLDPGESVTRTLVFQVPQAEPAAGAELWAQVFFRRHWSDQGNYPSRLIESGPIPLQLQPALAEREPTAEPLPRPNLFEHEEEREFSTLEQAEASFATRFARPTWLPQNSSIEAVEVISRASSLKVIQRYRLPGASLIELSQTHFIARDLNFVAMPPPDAQPLEWERYSGYARPELGGWFFTWGTSRQGFALSARGEQLDFETVLRIAQHVSH